MSDQRSSAPRERPLLVGAIPGVAEQLLLLGVPDESGVVHVQSWSAEDWSAPPPHTGGASVVVARVVRASGGAWTLDQSVALRGTTLAASRGEHAAVGGGLTDNVYVLGVNSTATFT
ncbi:MAG: hypothetical protein V4550_07030 [Gemmatimonadota bacterium]